MKTQDLIDIQAICQEGSFRRAAQRLNISQPTLSQRIAYLEQRLGALLFERSRGTSRPTALALQITQRSGRILDESKQLIRDSYRMAAGESGRIGLGFGPAPAQVLLSEVIGAIRQQAPQLAVECLIGTSEQLADLLYKNRIDAAVCTMDPVVFGDGAKVEQLVEGPMVVAAHPDHPFFGPESKGLEDFFQHSLALPVPEPAYREAAKNLFGVDMMQLDNAVYCSDYGVLIQLALEQNMLTAGPLFAFSRHVERGDLRAQPLDASRIRHSLGIITPRNQLPLPALNSALDCVRQTIAPYA